MKKARKLTIEQLRKRTEKLVTDEEAEAIIDSLEKLSVICCELFYKTERTNNRIIKLNYEDDERSGIAA